MSDVYLQSAGGMNVSESPRKEASGSGWAPSSLQIPAKPHHTGAGSLMRCPSPNVDSPAQRIKDGRRHAGLVNPASPLRLSSDEQPMSPIYDLDSPVLTPLLENFGIYRQGCPLDGPGHPTEGHPAALHGSGPTRDVMLQNWNDTAVLPSSPAQRIRHNMLACSTQGLRGPYSPNLSPSAHQATQPMGPPTSPAPAWSPSSSA